MQGETAMFMGRVKIMRDKLEPGNIHCFHRVPTEACEVAHLQSEDRGMICEECWTNIKAGYFRNDIIPMENILV